MYHVAVPCVTCCLSQVDDAFFGNHLGPLEDVPICLAEVVSMQLTSEHGM